MHLTPRELDKLILHGAGFLAQKRLARGLRLNYPEAVALIATQLLELIRDGRSRRRADGSRARGCSAARQVMPGVPELIARGAGRGHVPRRHQARHRARIRSRSRTAISRSRSTAASCPCRRASAFADGGRQPIAPGEVDRRAPARSSSTRGGATHDRRSSRTAATARSRSAATTRSPRPTARSTFDRARGRRACASTSPPAPRCASSRARARRCASSPTRRRGDGATTARRAPSSRTRPAPGGAS